MTLFDDPKQMDLETLIDKAENAWDRAHFHFQYGYPIDEEMWKTRALALDAEISARPYEPLLSAVN